VPLGQIPINCFVLRHLDNLIDKTGQFSKTGPDQSCVWCKH